MSDSRLLGNEDPCPCRSGKTFGECCLRDGRAVYQDGIPVVRLEELPAAHGEFLERKLEQLDRFGHVRPFVHADWRGEKWIAVGKEFFHSNKWKTPADFLSDYLKYVMTPAWGNAELTKPYGDRHPVMQWYDRTCKLQAQQTAGPDGVFGVRPSGAMRAYFLLAYDLYTLKHHLTLQASLVKRLRHAEQFQGARHELFATATCIRAGFTIEYESDPSKPQTEFIAVHWKTQQRISVEAKSRHRKGVLGMAGEREPDEQVRVKVRHLINDALNKPREYPYVIFLDLNLPPNSPPPLTKEWFEKVVDPIILDREGNDGEADPWNLLVISNFPDHYVDDDPAAGGYAVGMFGKNSPIVAANPDAIIAVHDAATKFGNLPCRFQELE
jgi:hypothetical protein